MDKERWFASRAEASASARAVANRATTGRNEWVLRIDARQWSTFLSRSSQLWLSWLRTSITLLPATVKHILRSVPGVKPGT
jgi:hypothetical protein